MLVGLLECFFCDLFYPRCYWQHKWFLHCSFQEHANPELRNPTNDCIFTWLQYIFCFCQQNCAVFERKFWSERSEIGGWDWMLLSLLLLRLHTAARVLAICCSCASLESRSRSKKTVVWLCTFLITTRLTYIRFNPPIRAHKRDLLKPMN